MLQQLHIDASNYRYSSTPSSVLIESDPLPVPVTKYCFSSSVHIRNATWWKKSISQVCKRQYILSVYKEGALDDAFLPDQMQKSWMRSLWSSQNEIEEASLQLLKLNLHGFFLEFRCFQAIWCIYAHFTLKVSCKSRPCACKFFGGPCLLTWRHK